jgi:uncharacterized phage protein (TIGR02220 family)
MKSKKSFILYNDQREVIETLTDEQVGKLFKALFAYVDGEAVNLEPIVNIAFINIRQSIDRAVEKWEEVAEMRSEFGKMGAEKRWKGKPRNEKMAKIAKAILPMANDGKNAVSVSVSVSDSVSDTKHIYGAKDKDFKEYLDVFNEVVNGKYRVMSEKTTRQIKKLISIGYTIDDWRTAIAKAYKNDYLCGRGDGSSTNYLTPEYISRPEKFQKWLQDNSTKKSWFIPRPKRDGN